MMNVNPAMAPPQAADGPMGLAEAARQGLAQRDSQAAVEAERKRAQLAKALNRLQKVSPTVQYQWRQFCAEQGRKVFNPLKVPMEVLEEFLERQPTMPPLEPPSLEMVEEVK